jgi:hypothetical protein
LIAYARSTRQIRADPRGAEPRRLKPTALRIGVDTPYGTSPAHNRPASAKTPTPKSV